MTPHCPTCTCGQPDRSTPPPDEPFDAVLLFRSVERAWAELLAEDRAAGRTWRRYSKAAA